MNLSRCSVTALLSGTLATAAIVSTLMAAETGLFDGSWEMDKSKSEGVPPDIEQHMKVTSSGNTLEVTTSIIADAGDRTIKDSYVLDDVAHEITPQLPNFPGATGKRTATASGNSGFQSRDDIVARDGETKITIVRKWSLSDDAKSVIITLDVSGPNGTIHSKRLFVRK